MPVKQYTKHALSLIFRETKGKVPIIACGGITTARDVIEYAQAGAVAVQLYTGMVYEGPGLIGDLKDQVTRILARNNVTWKQIVGNNKLRLID